MLTAMVGFHGKQVGNPSPEPGERIMKFDFKQNRKWALAGAILGVMVLALPLMGKPGKGPGPGMGQGPCMQEMKEVCPDAQTMLEKHKCMMENKDEFSQACQDRMKAMHEKMEKMHEACTSDREKFCEGVKPGQGRMMQCLKSHKDELSQECKDALPPGFFDRNGPPSTDEQ